jgi:hypothetical protein
VADVIVAESEIHGRGGFAALDFAAGETVLIIDDSRVKCAIYIWRRES